MNGSGRFQLNVEVPIIKEEAQIISQNLPGQLLWASVIPSSNNWTQYFYCLRQGERILLNVTRIASETFSNEKETSHFCIFLLDRSSGGEASLPSSISHIAAGHDQEEMSWRLWNVASCTCWRKLNAFFKLHYTEHKTHALQNSAAPRKEC